MEKIHMLLIEKDPAEARILEDMLKKQKCPAYEIVKTDPSSIISHELTGFSFDVILLDMSLPVPSEGEFFYSVYEKSKGIPIVLLCEKQDEEQALKLLGEGAQDYVCRSDRELICSMNKAILCSIERSRLKKLLNTEVKERKKVEETLRESQEQLSILVSNLPGMVYRCRADKEWTMLFISEGSVEVTGYLPEDLINNQRVSYNDLILEEYRNPIWEKWQKVLSERLPFEKEYPIHNASGEIKWVWERGRGIYNQQGDLLYLEGYIEDITDRKEAEKALIKEQYLNDMLIENIPDHIYFKDLESRFIRNNRSHAKSFGFDDPGKMIGKSDFDFFVKEFAQAAYDDEQQIIRTGQPISKEELAILEDQTKNWYLMTKMPLKDKDGKIVGTFGISRDITKLKQLNEELLLAKEKAEENDKLKSAFLANISHEIRTPMNGILGFSELLKDADITPEEHCMYIRIIEQSGQRMLSIINDIVDISKIEAGQMELHIQETHINQLLKDLRLFFLPNAREKGLELIFHNGLPDAKCMIETDRSKLTQTLTNLIKNALKFTSSGSISFGYTLLGEGMLEFYVRDTGEGIDSDQKNIIFERFRQGSVSLTRNYEGAGLGLSISKAYIEMLGGKLWVESEPGKGSVFFFTLPYWCVCPENLKQEADPDPDQPLRTIHILIAEDDENSMMYLCTILKNEKTELVLAANGQEAVDAVKSHPEIEIVLMDLKMPVMDGYEATCEIKRIRPSLPVIAQTAYAFSNDRDKAKAAGCDDFITKPVRKDLLIPMIMKYIRK